jgi:hypothetical protein
MMNNYFDANCGLNVDEQEMKMGKCIPDLRIIC